MSKKNSLYLLAGTGLMITGMATGLVLTSHAQSSSTTTNTNPNVAVQAKMGHRGGENSAERQAIDTAVANNDYEAWKTAVAKTPNGGTQILTKVDTQDKFNKLTQAFDLHQQADKIEDELGIKGLEKGPKGMMGQGGKMGR